MMTDPMMMMIKSNQSRMMTPYTATSCKEELHMVGSLAHLSLNIAIIGSFEGMCHSDFLPHFMSSAVIDKLLDGN